MIVISSTSTYLSTMIYDGVLANVSLILIRNPEFLREGRFSALSKGVSFLCSEHIAIFAWESLSTTLNRRSNTNINKLVDEDIMIYSIEGVAEVWYTTKVLLPPGLSARLIVFIHGVQSGWSNSVWLISSYDFRIDLIICVSTSSISHWFKKLWATLTKWSASDMSRSLSHVAGFDFGIGTTTVFRHWGWITVSM